MLRLSIESHDFSRGSKSIKHLLGHLVVTKSGDLNWAYSELIDGLHDAGESSEVVEALVKRRSELYGN